MKQISFLSLVLILFSNPSFSQIGTGQYAGSGYQPATGAQQTPEELLLFKVLELPATYADGPTGGAWSMRAVVLTGTRNLVISYVNPLHVGQAACGVYDVLAGAWVYHTEYQEHPNYPILGCRGFSQNPDGTLMYAVGGNHQIVKKDRAAELFLPIEMPQGVEWIWPRLYAKSPMAQFMGGNNKNVADTTGTYPVSLEVQTGALRIYSLPQANDRGGKVEFINNRAAMIASFTREGAKKWALYSAWSTLEAIDEFDLPHNYEATHINRSRALFVDDGNYEAVKGYDLNSRQVSDLLPAVPGKVFKDAYQLDSGTFVLRIYQHGDPDEGYAYIQRNAASEPERLEQRITQGLNPHERIVSIVEMGVHANLMIVEIKNQFGVSRLAILQKL